MTGAGRPPTGLIRRLAAASVAAAASVVMVGLPTPIAAQTPPEPVFELLGRSPWVAADGTFDLDVAVEAVPEDATVEVVIRSPLDGVDDLERSLDDDIGRVVHRTSPIPVGLIPALPDGGRRLTIATSVDPTDSSAARLREPGIYPVEIRLEAGTGVLGSLRTPLIRLGSPDDPLLAPTLDLVVDVGVAPTVTPDGRRQLTDDELGRLERLGMLLAGDQITERPPLPATVAAVPDTLEALAASADARAAAVLDAIAVASSDRELLASPPVPVSATALVRAGLGGYLPGLLDAGRIVLNDRFDLELDRSIWDGAGGVDTASARVLADAGIDHVLLDAPRARSDSPATERALVDAGPFPLDEIDPLDAVLVDRETSDELLARSTDRPDAGHIVLADLLLRDNGAGTHVVARIDDAPTDSVLFRLVPLLLTEGAPVEVGPVTLGRTRSFDGRGSDLDADDIVPASDTDLAPVADRVRTTTDSVATFAGFVMAESARADLLATRITTSLARGLDDEARTALLDAVSDEVATAFAGVTLSGQTDLNLTSRTGTLPLMIRNENPFPVRIVLRIRSERLAFPDGGRFEVAVTEEVTRVDVPVEALATGSVPTLVDIATPNERVVLDSQQLNVRSTAVSGVGLALCLGALAVLVFWWVRTWRKARKSGQPDAT